MNRSRGSSLPQQRQLERRHHNWSSEISQELRAHLTRRYRIVEGNTLHLNDEKSSGSSASVPHHGTLHLERSSSPNPNPRSLVSSSLPSSAGGSTKLFSSGGPSRYNAIHGSPPPSMSGQPKAGALVSGANSASMTMLSAAVQPSGSHEAAATPRVPQSTPTAARSLEHSKCFPGGALPRKQDPPAVSAAFCHPGERMRNTWAHRVHPGNAQYEKKHKVDTGCSYASNDKAASSSERPSQFVKVEKAADATADADIDQLQRDVELLRCQNFSLRDKVAAETQARQLVHAEKAQLELRMSAQEELFRRQSESLKVQQDQIANELIKREQFLSDRERLLQELEELRAERSRQNETEDLLEIRSGELTEVRAALRERLQKDAITVQENSRLKSELSQMQAERSKMIVQHEDLLSELEDLRVRLEPLEALETEVESLRFRLEEKEKEKLPHTPACSESRLRTVLSQQGTTSEQLSEAVRGVEALLGEAKRELSSRQHRDQRAAYERLHAAETQGDEHILEEAILEARRTAIDEEDIARAEGRLTQLRSLTDEQKAAKVAKELENQRKARAFLLVKKDDGTQLSKLLEQAEAEQQEVKWQDWRDHSGRTLLQFARELKASSAQRALSQLLSPNSPDSIKKHVGVARPAEDYDKITRAAIEISPRSHRSSCSPASPRKHSFPAACSPAAISPTRNSKVASPVASAVVVVEASPAASDVTLAPAAQDENVTPREMLSVPSEEAELKAQAFRSVVADDTASLVEALERLPKEIWSKWENRAGKDLLTLSQERGSSLAYSCLARYLGLLKEAKQESFEDRENVWVMVQGEVQPRRATVTAAAAEDCQEIMVEFWDGYEPAAKVDRCMVLKSNC